MCHSGRGLVVVIYEIFRWGLVVGTYVFFW
jgi:hypothetical protein